MVINRENALYILQKCQIDFDMEASWHPCGTFYTEPYYWLRVYFEEAVVAASLVIYLGSDGMTTLSVEPNKMIGGLQSNLTTNLESICRPNVHFYVY